jgi:hypothetical protein
MRSIERRSDGKNREGDIRIFERINSLKLNY